MNHIISDNPKHMRYLKKFDEKWNGSKSVVSEYTLSKDPIRIHCSECNAVYEKKYASEAIRFGCPNCYRETRKLNLASTKKKSQTTKEFTDKLKDKFEGRYILTGDYKNMKVTTTFLCIKCKKERRLRPDDLMYRTDKGCPCDAPETLARIERRRIRRIEARLAKRQADEERKVAKLIEMRRREEEFSAIFNDMWKSEYELLVPFDPADERVSLRHIPCGRLDYKLVSSLLKGHGCRRCSNRGESKAVVEIARILEEMGLSYEMEVRFPDCKRERVLPFDFGIYERGNLKFLIEYDGEHHYRPMYRRDGERRLKLVQERDAIKSAYCETKSIPLLRIKFTEFERVARPIDNLERIVKEFNEKLPSRH